LNKVQYVADRDVDSHLVSRNEAVNIKKVNTNTLNNADVTLNKIIDLPLFISYVVCPKSKCTDFPMYELAT